MSRGGRESGSRDYRYTCRYHHSHTQYISTYYLSIPVQWFWLRARHPFFIRQLAGPQWVKVYSLCQIMPTMLHVFDRHGAQEEDEECKRMRGSRGRCVCVCVADLPLCLRRGVRNGQKSRTLLRQKSTEINVRNQKSVGNRKSTVQARAAPKLSHRARAKPCRDERNVTTGTHAATILKYLSTYYLLIPVQWFWLRARHPGPQWVKVYSLCQIMPTMLHVFDLSWCSYETLSTGRRRRRWRM